MQGRGGIPPRPEIIQRCRGSSLPVSKKAVFSGASIGNPIKTGGKEFEENAPPSSPVRRAYELYNQFEGRSSWDQTAALYAVEEYRKHWSLHMQGHNHAFEDGSNEWRESPDKNHSYLIEKTPPAQLARIIDDPMLQPPAP